MLLRMLHEVVLKKLMNMLMKMFLVVLLYFLALFGDLMGPNFVVLQQVLHHLQDQGLFLLHLYGSLWPSLAKRGRISFFLMLWCYSRTW